MTMLNKNSKSKTKLINTIIRDRPGATGGIPGPCPPEMTACAPPNENCAPPERGLCPEEINRLGVTGVQIKAQIGVCHRYFCNFCELTPDFMTYLGWRPFVLEITSFRREKMFEFLISAGKSFRISMKTFLFVFFIFILEITCFQPEKTFEFVISPRKSLIISAKTFLLWRSSVFDRKRRLNFWLQPENPLEFQWRFFFFEITCFRPEKTFEFLISSGKSLWIFGLHLVYLIQTGINFSCPRALSNSHKQTSRAPPKFISAPQSRYFGAGPDLGVAKIAKVCKSCWKKLRNQPLEKYWRPFFST